MRLIECYVANFGVLHDYTYQPEAGLNCEYIQNGHGKSTFTAFMRAMFYGMPATRTKKQLDEAERRKYKPWQGGTWGGSVTFACGGKTYKLERTFGDRDKDDTFRLLNWETGLESMDYTQDIGSELFGVDRNAYSNTLMVSAAAMRVQMNDSLSARLDSNQSTDEEKEQGVAVPDSESQTVLQSMQRGSSDELMNYEHAITMLEREYKVYRKTGNRGLIAQQEQQLRELEQSLWEIQKQYQAEKQYQTEKLHQTEILHQTEKQYQTDKQAKVMAPGQMSAADTEMNLDAGITSSLGLTNKEMARLEQLDDYFSSGVPDADEIQQKMQRLHQKKAQLERYSRKQVELDTQTEQSSKVPLLLLVAAVLFGIAGFAGMAFSGIGYLLLELPAVLCLGGAVIGRIYDRAKAQRLLNRSSDTNTGSDTDSITGSGTGSNTDWYSDPFADPELERRMNAIEAQEKKLMALDRYRIEYQYLSEKEENAKKAAAIVKKEKLQVYEEQRKAQELERSEKMVELRKKVNELKNELEVSQRKAEVLGQTIAYLKKAKEQYTAAYVRDVSRYFLDYLALFDADLAHRAKLDVNFDISVTEQGYERQIEYYSSAYRDMIWFCERLSLIESVFTTERPFLILDDPFVNLDDEMMQKAADMLQLLSEKYQIIYLTCQSGRNL